MGPGRRRRLTAAAAAAAEVVRGLVGLAVVAGLLWVLYKLTQLVNGIAR